MQVQKNILIAIIFVVCLASYCNTLPAHFVWDDNIFILHNPYLRSFKFLPTFFLQDFWSVGIQKLPSGYYRPLLAASFMLDHLLWHARPFGYHLINLLMHSLAGILLFLFLKSLLKDTLIPFFASLVFSAHPLHTESVSFISGRVDIIALIFMLVALMTFLKYYLDKNPFQYLLSLGFFLLALLTKEMAVTLPLILLCLDYLFLSNGEIRRVIKNFSRIHLGFFAVLVLYLFIRFLFVNPGFIISNTRFSSNFLPGDAAFWRAFTAAKILWFYIRLLIFPYNLQADYFFPAAHSLFEPAVITGIVLLIVLVCAAIKNIKGCPVLTFSIAWFFITILPVTNIVPIGNIFAERYMYIPSVGFSIAVGFFFFWLLKKNISLRNLNWKASIYSIFSLMIIASGRVTFERNKVWNNEFTLWYETAKASPDSPRAHLNLGSAYYSIGYLREAIKEAGRAQALYPNYYEAFDLAGDIYLKKGLVDEAIKAYRIAIGISPDRDTAYNSLSVALAKSGRYKEAIGAGLEALKRNPYFDEARYNLALNYSQTGQIDEAIKAYEGYIEANPDNYKALVELGYLCYKKEDKKLAKSYWIAALKISPGYKPAMEALKLFIRR